MRGLDADTAALAVTVDPNPLSAIGEILALTSGRGTYSLTWRIGRYELDYRDQWNIAHRHPDELHVVGEHRCGIPLPTRGEVKKPAERVSEECPF